MPTLALNLIRTDGGTQSREAIDAATVREYADDIRAGIEFPEAVVYYDGADYWLADGFHRRAAYAEAGRAEMPVEVRQGSRRDAILHSVGANADHGRRRSNADKRRSVTTMLCNEDVSRDEAGRPWSDRAIARLCAVSNRFVSDLRAETPSVNGSQMQRVVQRGGKTYTMNTAGINANRVAATDPDSQIVPDDEAGQADTGDSQEPAAAPGDDAQVSRAEYAKRLASGTDPLPLQRVADPVEIDSPAATPATPDIDSVEAAQQRRAAADATDELLAKAKSAKPARKPVARAVELADALFAVTRKPFSQISAIDVRNQIAELRDVVHAIAAAR